MNATTASPPLILWLYRARKPTDAQVERVSTHLDGAHVVPCLVGAGRDLPKNADAAIAGVGVGHKHTQRAPYPVFSGPVSRFAEHLRRTLRHD